MSISSIIPEEEIIERLQTENPWWTTKNVSEYYTEMKRRLYFNLFYPYVTETEVRRALVLMGPRRVGKTVMLFHTISRLIDDGLDPQKICFVGVDNPIYINLSLENLLALYKKALKTDTLEGCYVFFDEVQFLKDWERHLKVLVDSYPNTKFIVSGSAAAAIHKKSSESGAGRFTDFMLPPLTFQEYIHLNDNEHLIVDGVVQYGEKEVSQKQTNNIKALNEEFVNYLNFGGYPEVVLSKRIRNDMQRYVKNDIIDKVLLKDLPGLYKINDVQELNRFFAYIAYSTGQEMSYQKIAKDSGINKTTLKKYLEYLEDAFLIKVLYRVDNNAKKLRRITRFKVYLTSPSLRAALFSPISELDEVMGNMVETAILSQWMHREHLDLTYAQWKQGRKEGEVDLVLLDNKAFKPAWAVEIKWSNRFYENPNKLKSLIHFCKVNNLRNALITSIDKSGNKVVEDIEFTFVPASLYAYNIGVGTLDRKTRDEI